MKKQIVLLVIVIIATVVRGQENFEWKVVIDSLDATKSELFDKTSQFLASNWKSAQDVVQYSDKETGTIIIKGASIHKPRVHGGVYPTFIFNYTAKMQVKDGKARIILSDVYCSDAIAGVYSWPKMPVSDYYPEKKGIWVTGLKEKDYTLLMSSLKSELQGIVDSYIEYVNYQPEEW
jgi:hypothetical protein